MNLRSCVTINLSALKHNLKRVKYFAPEARILAMVKANAYGHDMVQVAEALQEADAFGVATLEEALCLRESGCIKPIMMMGGFIDTQALQTISKQGISTVVHHVEQLSMLEQTKIVSPMSVWLKLNSGMHRLGFNPKDFVSAYERLSLCKNINKPIGLMTHLACSDIPDHDEAKAQVQLFENCLKEIGVNLKVFSQPISIASSAGIMIWPSTHYNWVRPGIMLYGASPFSDKTGVELGLKPVMTLKGRLMAIQPVQQGESIGYSATYVAAKDMMIGVVGLGYGDGYPRQAKNGTPTLIRGKNCPLVGRVSMDFITIDLSNQPNAKIGDEVVLWGEGLPAELVAEPAGTIAYELFCKVTERVARIYSFSS